MKILEENVLLYAPRIRRHRIYKPNTLFEQKKILEKKTNDIWSSYYWNKRKNILKNKKVQKINKP